MHGGILVVEDCPGGFGTLPSVLIEVRLHRRLNYECRARCMGTGIIRSR